VSQRIAVRPSLLTLALALALAPACLSAEWTRESRQSPPSALARQTLSPGSTALSDALELLGAPLDVYEYRQTGLALAYGWYRSDAKGLRVSVPIYERASASVDYSDNREGLKGLLLLFDEHLRLVSIREGWLADLTAGLERQSPALLDDVEEEAPPGGQPKEPR